jgi:hypothetical protein
MNIVFTVCNRYTFANACVLGESVLRHQRDSVFYIGWVDTIPVPAVPERVKTLTIGAIDIPGFQEMCERYYDFELIAACRPWFARFILAHPEMDCESLTFLAPSTVLLREIPANDADLVLTPNIPKPLLNSPDLDDKRILNVGMFNSGSWALKKSGQTIKLINWWADRTFDRAKFDLCNGMCMDQLWLNYAPVWVERTAFRNNTEWHYGLRSVLNDKLVFRDGKYEINGRELVSVDFTGLAGFDPVWSDHVGLLALNRAYNRLYKEYQNNVKAYEIDAERNVPVFGVKAQISKQRLFRKKMIAALDSVTDFIDAF